MNRRMRQWSTVLVAMIILIAVILFTRHLIIAQQVGQSVSPQAARQPQRPDVAVIAVDGAAYNAPGLSSGPADDLYAPGNPTQIICPASPDHDRHPLRDCRRYSRALAL